MKAKLVPLSSTDNQQRFYRAVLEFLNEGGFHYLVGGGHALEQYAGPLRVSKDLDLFGRRADVSRRQGGLVALVAAALSAAAMALTVSTATAPSPCRCASQRGSL